jgi:AcrR family transcriptional regulator
MGDPVKGKSDAGRRRELRAQQTRERIIDAAVALFLDRGYTGTTVEQIAREAGVAPATVYQAFGSKRLILARALEVRVAGDAEPVALLDRGWVDQARTEPDAGRRLEIVVEHAAVIAARTAAVKEVLRDAAAIEPDLADLITIDHQRRYRTQQALVAIIAGDGQLRDGTDLEQATATFFALVNSHGYTVLAEQLHWSVSDWQTWLTAVLHRELLGADPPSSQEQP